MKDIVGFAIDIVQRIWIAVTKNHKAATFKCPCSASFPKLWFGNIPRFKKFTHLSEAP